jgi:hypothetical protein
MEAGGSLPSSPACSCGCGGTYMMQNSGMMRNDYFSDTLVDPPACTSDPLHRDRTNGPWFLQMTSTYMPVAGNDWTLFRSGDIFTEFPNLYEGNSAPSADSVVPSTDEDDPDPAGEVYDGHPWDGRGQVTYHGYGNAMSVVEIELEDSAITPGEIRSYIYLKGDQKDVWKPQQAISLKYVLFETPL